MFQFKMAILITGNNLALALVGEEGLVGSLHLCAGSLWEGGVSKCQNPHHVCEVGVRGVEK